MDSIGGRAQREREHYNKGLKRALYTKIFRGSYFYRRQTEEILQQHLQHASGQRVLELGSHCWVRFIEATGIQPRELECINISETELQRGIDAAKTSQVKPRFTLMDANDLRFPDESFDLVFGKAILHHLDLARALSEIRRVLKLQGRFVFLEPLGVNPVAKLVRLLTPLARTPDERPLGRKELAEIQGRFDTTLYYQQFLSVPVAVLSNLLRFPPDGRLLKWAYQIDSFMEQRIPPIRILYRYVIIAGTKR
jgi:SAM-dependent methyltransferase